MAQLRVDVEVNNSKVASGLNGIKQSVGKWAEDVKHQIAGAFSSMAIYETIKSTAEHLNSMGDSADSMGRTVQEVQLLAQMAQLAGKELSNVEMVLNNISEAQIDALQGGSTGDAKMKTFQAAGLSKEDVQDKSNLAIAEQMARVFADKSVQELRAIGMSDIVGKKQVGTFAAMQPDMSNFSGTLKEKSDSGLLYNEVELAKFKIAIDDATVAVQDGLTPVIDFFVGFFADVIDGLRAFYNIFANFIARNAAWLGGWSVGGSKAGDKAAADVDKEYEASYDEIFAARQKRQQKAQERVDAAKANSATGPGVVEPKKEEKEKKFGQARSGDTNLARGNFMGERLGSSYNIELDSNKQLKIIAANTRRMLYYKTPTVDIGTQLGLPA
jgi:hypothetical protein